jgi:hypothetical protein
VPFYDYEITIPAGTPATAPVRALARLTRGVITRVEILFPAGCAGPVSSYAEREGAQVWPSNPDGRFRADDETVDFVEEYVLRDEPTTVTLFGYAPNARFPHIVTWRFEVLPLARWEARQAAEGLIPRLARFLGVR